MAWDIPTMQSVITEIDSKHRPGSFGRMVATGERYAVERVSDVELRMRLLQPASPARPQIVTEGGLKLLQRGRVLREDEVQRILAEFP